MSTFTELQTTTPTSPPPQTLETAESGAAATPESTPSTLTRLTHQIPNLDTIQQNLHTIWTSSRPWSEFTNTTQFTKPSTATDILPRLRENYHYYFSNYLLLLLLLSLLTILTSPLAFLGGVFVFVAYMYLFIFNPEAIVLWGGVSLNNGWKAGLILGFALVVLWTTGAGATFTGLVVVVGVLATLHAAFRRPVGEADFETAYTPATV